MIIINISSEPLLKNMQVLELGYTSRGLPEKLHLASFN